MGECLFLFVIDIAFYKFIVDSPKEEMNLKAELKEEILSIIQNYDNKI